MLKLIAASVLLLAGLAASQFATEFTLFGPTQYLSLHDADVPPELLGSVLERRVAQPDVTNQAQYLQVPGESEITFRSVASPYSEVLRFRLVLPQDKGPAIRYRVEVFDGKTRTTLFDSKDPGSARDGDAYRVCLPPGMRARDLIFVTASDPSLRGAWIDLRIEYNYGWLWPVAAGLLVLGAAMLVWWWRSTPTRRERVRGAAKISLLFVGLLVAAAVAEYAIRRHPLILGERAVKKLYFARRVPGSIVRFALGQPAARVQDTEFPRIGTRLRRNVRTRVWQDNGLIYVKGNCSFRPNRSVVQGEFYTDDRGFPNKTTLDRAEITVLGDSFCELGPTDSQWPHRLSALTDRVVCNFGVRATGTIQQRAVYENIASALGSKVVILMFYEGNDVPDNIMFQRQLDSKESPRIEQTPQIFMMRRPLSQATRRTDRSLLFYALSEWLGPLAPLLSDRRRFEGPFYRNADGITVAARNNRIPMPDAGRSASMAFNFKYMITPSQSIERIKRHEAGQITLRELRELQRTISRENGPELVIVCAPTKIRVYMPLLEESMGTTQLEKYIGIIAHTEAKSIDAKQFTKNAANLSRLLEEFCGKNDIPYLDLAPSLRKAAREGPVPYLEDDTHFTATGHEIAAKTIAKFLKENFGENW